MSGRFVTKTKTGALTSLRNGKQLISAEGGMCFDVNETEYWPPGT